MAFTREISRLMFGVLIAFFIVIASASYWAIVGADSILLRDDNPRLVEALARIQRGSIYDRSETLLVETITEANETISRRYYHPEAYSILGYYSLRYGTAGVEAAFDALLSGATTTTPSARVIQQDLLHRPQQGSDIRLTLDIDVQQTIINAMEGSQGAAVVLSVPDGAVLGFVSLPTYDPNLLDDEWEQLIEAQGNPFFNRVLQGQYQPGGMLQTPLMVAGILSQQPFDIVTADANRPVPVDDMQVGCALEPESPDLTYTEAYAYGCPYPFALLARELSTESLQNIFGAFQLTNPPTIAGFNTTALSPEITETPQANLEPNLIEDIVGQGELTINPLGMVTIAAAVINAGNAPQPYILDSYRTNDETWQRNPITLTSTPLMTANAARRLRELMNNNVRMGASMLAARPDLMIGGHSALVISGDETQSWFMGYVSLSDQRGVAIALILEDTDNATDAAAIGGIILESAAHALQQPID
ncbi:MAG: penicillin-binding transpeptidase domain-containing protein [Phototrophicaceae bacterium]